MSETKPQTYRQSCPLRSFVPLLSGANCAAPRHRIDCSSGSAPPPFGSCACRPGFRVIDPAVQGPHLFPQGAGPCDPAGGTTAPRRSVARTAAFPHQRTGRSPAGRVTLCLRRRNTGVGRAHFKRKARAKTNQASHSELAARQFPRLIAV